jgi:hypothetical protein
LCSYRYFEPCYWNSLSSYIFCYPVHFINHSTWFNDNYLMFEKSFPQTHTCFRGYWGNWFIGKYTYSYFSTAVCISCHYPTPCFYLSRRNPSRFKCLKSISITSIRYSFHSSSMSFIESSSFGIVVNGCFIIPSIP